MASFSSTKFAVSKNPQSDIATAELDTADLIRLTPTSREIPFPKRNTADNSDEFGAGLWPDKVYKLNSILEQSVTFRGNSQFAAWAAAFALGGLGATSGVTKSTPGAGAYRYTCRPNVARKLKPFTFIVQNNEGTAEEVLDIANVGVFINSLAVALRSGTDQDTFNFTMGLIGSGRYVNNSGTGTTVATMPATTSVNQLSVADVATLSVVGQDYASTCRLKEFNFEYNNQFKTDQNYSACANAKQDGFFVMSNSLCGKPTFTLSGKVEAAAGSPEAAAFLAGTTGTIQLALTGPEIVTGVNHAFQLNIGKAQFTATNPSEVDDIFTFDFETKLLTPDSGEALEIIVTTNMNGIFGL